MKTILILYTLLIGTYCATTERKTDELDDATAAALNRLPPHLRGMIAKIFHPKFELKHEMSCDDATNKLKKAVILAMKCAVDSDNTVTVCTSIKTQLMPCITPIINVTEECMPEKSKGIPTLMIKSIINGLKYSCGLTVEQLFELFNDCVLPDDDKYEERTFDLEQKLTTLKTDLTVKNMCSVGHDLKDLIKGDVEKRCPNAMTKSVMSGLMDAVLAECIAANKI